MEQEFITIKKVTAVDMPSGVAEQNGYDTKGRTGDGVEVTNEDEYKTWCPLAIFKENNFSTTHNPELASTCRMMVSENYKERFRAEYIQVKNRYNGLKKMLDKWDNGELSFNPSCPRETYGFQLRAMKDYMDILVVRAEIENIRLS